jgi:hypothetical protein
MLPDFIFIEAETGSTVEFLVFFGDAVFEDKLMANESVPANPSSFFELSFDFGLTENCSELLFSIGVMILLFMAYSYKNLPSIANSYPSWIRKRISSMFISDGLFFT